MSDYDIKLDENLIIKVEDIDHCQKQIIELITNNAIDAVFAVNELFAVTAIKAINKIGKKVPDDIAVIGFTDGIISQFSTPTITTVSQNGIKMGQKAAKMLIERLEKEEDDDLLQLGLARRCGRLCDPRHGRCRRASQGCRGAADAGRGGRYRQW